jgi:hypothetical protein
MQADNDQPAANANAQPVSAQELAGYRANLDALMQRCLASVRRAPLLDWNADERSSR